jgi:hypothetical protein
VSREELLKIIEEGMRSGLLRAREEACVRMAEICDCIDMDPKFEPLLAQDVLRVQHFTQRLAKVEEMAARAIKALDDDVLAQAVTQREGDA